MIDAVLVADPEVANMVTAPSEIAVTRPFDKTVAREFRKGGLKKNLKHNQKSFKSIQTRLLE